MEYVYITLVVMPLFVFGFLLFRKGTRPPKELIIAIFISYILVASNVLYYVFKLPLPEVLMTPCTWIVMMPSYCIAACIMALFEDPAFFLKNGWLGASVMSFFDRAPYYAHLVICLLAFIVNTLLIFAIIRLILRIKHKVSAQKT
jgi:hypothetical protein